ncbi:hypothetical protein M440DRAFT_1223251 [Trichoderma longibrachiatum ATCC 18648]|uniref:Uncharacterized protein n=1 Tax=Trichoderma longibrachiatum ATCC 18648 TaxID=983965 RepID=A0A2T4C895_TRILO|nr:hypothetical protein M440DRAFT_1223251 [Trichoderma longibrachiatum ATCC 18648]
MTGRYGPSEGLGFAALVSWSKAGFASRWWPSLDLIRTSGRLESKGLGPEAPRYRIQELSDMPRSSTLVRFCRRKQTQASASHISHLHLISRIYINRPHGHCRIYS